MAGRRRGGDAAAAAAEANAAAQAPDTTSNNPEPEIARNADAPPKPAPRNNPRDDIMEELVALREKGESGPADQVHETPRPSEKPDEPAQPDAAPPVAADASQTAAQAAPEAAAPVAAAPEAPKTSKQIVDGKEYDVPLSEIEEAGSEKAWRINRAAQNRLERINQAVEESKANTVAVQQQQQALAAWLQRQQQPQVSQEQVLQQHLDLIRNGTPEQGAAALQAIIRANVPQVNPIEIQNTSLFKFNQQQAAAKFREEFPEIASNPQLMEYAAFQENRMLPEAIRQTGITSASDPRFPHFDFGQFYRNIGNQIRGNFQRQSQPQAAPQPQGAAPQAGQAPTSGNPSPAQSEREARKASIVNLPTASARAELPAEEKPESREEIFNQMRKARGQTPL